MSTYLLRVHCLLPFSIKNDDRLIQAEGIESLSEAELREDCRERGMLGELSVEEMRKQVCITTKVYYLQKLEAYELSCRLYGWTLWYFFPVSLSALLVFNWHSSKIFCLFV